MPNFDHGTAEYYFQAGYALAQNQMLAAIHNQRQRQRQVNLQQQQLPPQQRPRPAQHQAQSDFVAATAAAAAPYSHQQQEPPPTPQPAQQRPRAQAQAQFHTQCPDHVSVPGYGHPELDVHFVHPPLVIRGTNYVYSHSLGGVVHYRAV